MNPIATLIDCLRRNPTAGPARPKASTKALAATLPIDRRPAGISLKEPSAMILVAPASPHTSMNTTPAERDRVAAAFDDEAVNRLAVNLLYEIERSLKNGGVRGLIAGAIHIAANGITSNGAAQGLANVEPSDVARALELLIQASQEEQEAERARAAKHREAQNAARGEWDELAAAVRERHDSVAAELTYITEQQRILRVGGGIPADQRFELQMVALRTSGLDEMAARELLQRATGAKKGEPPMGRDELNKRAAELNARIARFEAFSADRRKNFWVLYDHVDSALDVLLESVAERLGIPVPQEPIEAPAAA